MSDYLTHLVARSIAMAPVVRPRSISLFAPERNIAQPVFAPELFLDTTLAATPVMAPPRPLDAGSLSSPQVSQRPLYDGIHRAPLTSFQPHADQPQPLPDMFSATPRSQPTPRLIEPSADEARLSEPAAPQRQPGHVVQPTPAAANRPPRADEVEIQTAPALQRRVIERVIVPQLLPPPAAQPTPVPAPQQRVIEQTIVLEPSRSADSLRPASSPQVVEQPRVVPAPIGVQPTPPHAQSVASTPSIIQPARRATPATIAPQPAASTPTIHVTIGRIEVRATPPPSRQTQSKSAPVPTISLDDYLRGRSGGRR